MKKVASIDIGTNSMRLLIAEGETDLYNRRKYVNLTRLGRGVDQNGYIDEETMERNLKALHDFVQLARREDVEEIEVIGTSALRDSKNRQEFIDRAGRLSGVNIRVIEGSEEAFLGFYGAIGGLKKRGYILLLDIGGGSTEFVLGSFEEGILFSKSIDIGAVRLTERFSSDKGIVTERQIKEMRDHVLMEIREVYQSLKNYLIEETVGIGGTVTTFSAMVQGMKEYDMEKIHQSVLKAEEVDSVVSLLAAKTLEERMMVDGLQPQRADIIVAGGVILSTIMNVFSMERLTVSEYDNLEGILYTHLRDEKKKDS